MNFKNLRLVPVVAFTIAACNTNEVDIKAEEAALMKTDSTWSVLAAEGKDTEKTLSYWSEDAVVIAPGQPVVRGKQALRNMVEETKNIPGFSITWKSSGVQISGDGKMAYMYGENI